MIWNLTLCSHQQPLHVATSLYLDIVFIFKEMGYKCMDRRCSTILKKKKCVYY